jgi:hypothetical protein
VAIAQLADPHGDSGEAVLIDLAQHAKKLHCRIRYVRVIAVVGRVERLSKNRTFLPVQKRCINYVSLMTAAPNWPSMAALNRLAHTEIPESKSAEAKRRQAIEEVEAQFDTRLVMSTRRLIDEAICVKKAKELKAKLKDLRKAQASAGQQTMN